MLISRLYKIDGITFCKKLNLCGCLLYGSYILSIFYNTNEYNNINIIYNIPPPEDNLYLSDDEEVPKYSSEGVCSPFEKYLLAIGFDMVDEKTEYSAIPCDYVRLYKRYTSDIPIMFIRTNINEEMDRIFAQYFDASITMNFFDGITLDINNKRDIMEKKFTFSMRKRSPRDVMVARLQKYYKLGYEEIGRINEIFKDERCKVDHDFTKLEY